jgi:hypothetical protein
MFDLTLTTPRKKINHHNEANFHGSHPESICLISIVSMLLSIDFIYVNVHLDRGAVPNRTETPSSVTNSVTINSEFESWFVLSVINMSVDCDLGFQCDAALHRQRVARKHNTTVSKCKILAGC